MSAKKRLDIHTHAHTWIDTGMYKYWVGQKVHFGCYGKT